jgi:hypothetical protein
MSFCAVKDILLRVGGFILFQHLDVFGMSEVAAEETVFLVVDVAVESCSRA